MLNLYHKSLLPIAISVLLSGCMSVAEIVAVSNGDTRPLVREFGEKTPPETIVTNNDYAAFSKKILWTGEQSFKESVISAASKVSPDSKLYSWVEKFFFEEVIKEVAKDPMRFRSKEDLIGFFQRLSKAYNLGDGANYLLSYSRWNKIKKTVEYSLDEYEQILSSRYAELYAAYFKSQMLQDPGDTWKNIKNAGSYITASPTYKIIDKKTRNAKKISNAMGGDADLSSWAKVKQYLAQAPSMEDFAEAKKLSQEFNDNVDLSNADKVKQYLAQAPSTEEVAKAKKISQALDDNADLSSSDKVKQYLAQAPSTGEVESVRLDRLGARLFLLEEGKIANKKVQDEFGNESTKRICKIDDVLKNLYDNGRIRDGLAAYHAAVVHEKGSDENEYRLPSRHLANATLQGLGTSLPQFDIVTTNTQREDAQTTIRINNHALLAKIVRYVRRPDSEDTRASRALVYGAFLASQGFAVELNEKDDCALKHADDIWLAVFLYTINNIDVPENRTFIRIMYESNLSIREKTKLIMDLPGVSSAFKATQKYYKSLQRN